MRRGSKKRVSPYWLCRGCGFRNERANIKCRGEGCRRTRPKKSVPKHAIVLRDTSHEAWAEFSQKLHGGTLGACAICGKLPKIERNNDRDHDHWKESIAYGKARGILCPFCNAELLKHMTLERAWKVLMYLLRVELHYMREGIHQTEGERDDASAGVGQ